MRLLQVGEWFLPSQFFGPRWSGETPAGIGKVFHRTNEFAFTIFRTQLFSPADLTNVAKVQAGYSVKSLSAHLRQTPPPPAPAIDWPAAGKEMFGADFPNYLNFLLQFMPDDAVPASEQTERQRFAAIGIGAGDAFDASALPASRQAALGDAIKAAEAEIEATAAAVGTKVNGWQIGAAAGDRAFFGGNWALRAAVAMLGIYGNSEAEAVYPFTRADVNGVPLDGSRHEYTLTFSAEQLPPVDAFWSVMMYDGETQLLIEKPIDR